MEISIWSDIRCPFCYIGKRKFEAALEQFEHKDQVRVVWKSFELDPHLETLPQANALEHFCKTKGVDLEQARQMFNHASTIGKEVGLDLNFDISVVANSLNAHRLIHYAATEKKAPQMKEALLHAYFTEGKNIDDLDFLVALAHENGLDPEAVHKMLVSDAYTYDVRQDEMEAKNLGVGGVPFFVLDNKFGISGAQPVATFLNALEEAWTDQEGIRPSADATSGAACDIDGAC